MQIYNSISYTDAEPELRTIYDEIIATLHIRELPNWVTYLGHAPHILKGMWEMLKGTQINGHLNPLLQELIIFSVSRANGSPYCTEFHGATALRMSETLTWQDLLEISEGNSQGQIPKNFQIAISVAVKHSQAHCELNLETIEALEDEGFDQQQIMEINALVSLALMFNAYTMNANIPIDESHKVS